jgi:hypothetical protein
MPGSDTMPALWPPIGEHEGQPFAGGRRCVHEPTSFARLRLMVDCKLADPQLCFGLIKHKISWRMIG